MSLLQEVVGVSQSALPMVRQLRSKIARWPRIPRSKSLVLIASKNLKVLPKMVISHP
jgi:hypothetical protein